MTKEPAAAFRQRLTNQVEQTNREVRELTADLTPDELLLRPGQNRWGVGDCLEHLVATGNEYHSRIREALDRSPRKLPSSDYRPRVFGQVYVHFAGPEGWLRLPALGPFSPPPTRADVTERFLAQQGELIDLIEASGKADLNRIRIGSPLGRLFTLTLGECLQLLVNHQRRHMAQAHRAREELPS